MADYIVLHKDNVYSPLLSIAEKIYNKFKCKTEKTREKCVICSSSIAFTSLTSASCEKGHSLGIFQSFFSLFNCRSLFSNSSCDSFSLCLALQLSPCFCRRRFVSMDTRKMSLLQYCFPSNKFCFLFTKIKEFEYIFFILNLCTLNNI